MNKKFKKITSYLMAGLFTIGIMNSTLFSNKLFIQKAYADTIDYTQVKSMGAYNPEQNVLYFLYNDGSVKVANIGCNNNGTGYATSVSELFPAGSVSKIYSKTYTTYFLMSDGTVKGVGDSTSGQLGNSTTNPTPVTVPVSNVKDIYTNGSTTYFLLNDGTVKGLGVSTYGQLGNTNATNSTLVTVPVSNVNKISTSGNTSYFLLNDGSIKGLGNSPTGQLGNTIATNSTPLTISIANVKDIYTNGASTYFLLTDNTVKGLGVSSNGQLGNTNATNSTAVTVPVSDVKEVDISGSAIYFILNDGTIKGLGVSSLGQLGNTNITNSTPVTVPVSGINDIVPINGGAVFHTNNGMYLLGKCQGIIGADSTVSYSTPLKLDTSKYKDILFVVSGWDSYYIADDGIYVFGYGLNGAGENSTSIIFKTQVNETTPVKLNTLFQLTDQFTKTINSKSQTDFNDYFNLVNTLPSGQTKDYWNVAIDTPYAEKTFYTDDWQTATNFLSNMNNATTLYSQYNTRLTNLKPKIEPYAENLIETAELSRNQSDINLAYKFTMDLNTNVSTNRQSMLIRLDTIASGGSGSTSGGTIINPSTSDTEIMGLLNSAMDLLTKSISPTSLQMIKTNLDIAKQKIDALDDTDINKTILSNQYQSLLSNYNVAVISYNDLLLTNATNAVNIAKQTMKQSDIDYANTQIAKLSDGADKTNLQNQITTLINDINTLITNSTNAVITAETSKTQADVDSARTLIYSLPDSTTKTDLQTRLNVVQEEIINTMTGQQLIDTATNYVGKAETDKTQLSIDMARIFVDKLPDSTTKTDLQNRLDVVQQSANTSNQQNQQDLQTLINNATNSVQQAEMTQSLIDVQSARTLVNLLPEGITKTDLENRLNAIVVCGTLTPQNMTNEVDVILKSNNTLEMSMSMNIITFEDFNPASDTEKQNAMGLNILSNLPYSLTVTGLDDFKNSNGDTISISHLQMKVHDDTDYKTLIKNTPVIIAENQPPTASKDYSIDMKMLSDALAKEGVYKTTVKFAVQQQ